MKFILTLMILAACVPMLGGCWYVHLLAVNGHLFGAFIAGVVVCAYTLIAGAMISVSPPMNALFTDANTRRQILTADAAAHREVLTNGLSI